jgi:hypothetical protein
MSQVFATARFQPPREYRIYTINSPLNYRCNHLIYLYKELTRLTLARESRVFGGFGIEPGWGHCLIRALYVRALVRVIRTNYLISLLGSYISYLPGLFSPRKNTREYALFQHTTRLLVCERLGFLR